MQEQLQFLKEKYIPLIREADIHSKPKWGKMDFQQMIEHVIDFFQVSTQKQHYPFVSPPEHLEKLKAFLMSDKQFRENTKAPANIIGEEPRSHRFETVEIAINELASEVDHFFQFYENKPDQTALHPVFGTLNFDEWVLLHFKHVRHHAKQFGFNEDDH